MTRRRRLREETSAGGVVFRRAADETLFLLIRDSYQNWGFPKGHLEAGEPPDSAALREVTEETGLGTLTLRAPIDTIDWHFRFRGRRIHKVCHFYLIETAESATTPQRAEGITACRWAPYPKAVRMIAYPNARAVLKQAWSLLARGTNGAPLVSASAIVPAELARAELAARAMPATAVRGR